MVYCGKWKFFNRIFILTLVEVPVEKTILKKLNPKLFLDGLSGTSASKHYTKISIY